MQRQLSHAGPLIKVTWIRNSSRQHQNKLRRDSSLFRLAINTSKVRLQKYVFMQSKSRRRLCSSCPLFHRRIFETDVLILWNCPRNTSFYPNLQPLSVTRNHPIQKPSNSDDNLIPFCQSRVFPEYMGEDCWRGRKTVVPRVCPTLIGRPPRMLMRRQSRCCRTPGVGALKEWSIPC
jgi:hypothetical protein